MGAELNISEPGRRERRLIDAGELGDVLRDELGSPCQLRFTRSIAAASVGA